MFRVWLILGFVALVFWVFAIVDVSVQPGNRHRGMSKPTWIAIVVLLPVLGGVLWFVLGRLPASVAARRAPDDDPDFLSRIGTVSDQDERIRRLEEELAALDAEADDPPRQGPAAPGPTPGPVAPKVERPTDRPEDDDTRGQRGAVG